MIASAMNAMGYAKHSLVLNIIKSFVMPTLAYFFRWAMARWLSWSVMIANIAG